MVSGRYISLEYTIAKVEILYKVENRHSISDR